MPSTTPRKLGVFLLLVLGMGTMGLAAPFPGDDKPIPVLEDPPPEEKNQSRLPYYGIVTAIDKESITITGGQRRVEEVGPGPDGKWIVQKVIIYKGQPPRKFLACDALASGKFKKTPLTSSFETYRLSDVSVGDHVRIGYIRLNGVDIVEDISIRRRPGGLVPPAPGEDPKETNKWHDRCNAREFLIVKAVPTLPQLALRFIR